MWLRRGAVVPPVWGRIVRAMRGIDHASECAVCYEVGVQVGLVVALWWGLRRRSYRLGSVETFRACRLNTPPRYPPPSHGPPFVAAPLQRVGPQADVVGRSPTAAPTVLEP